MLAKIIKSRSEEYVKVDSIQTAADLFKDLDVSRVKFEDRPEIEGNDFYKKYAVELYRVDDRFLIENKLYCNIRMKAEIERSGESVEHLDCGFAKVDPVFDLFAGCLGNGITICNKAIVEHGDYKCVAHISNMGHTKYYVDPGTIPGDALLRIEHMAAVAASKWEGNFSKMKEGEQYSYLLTETPIDLFFKAIDKKLLLKEKIDLLKKEIYKLHI